MLLLLLLLGLAPSTATLSGERWVDLQPTDEAQERSWRRPVVTHRDVQVDVRDDHVLIEAVWTVQPGDRRWFVEPVIGPHARVEAVTWDGRPARLHAVRRGFVAPHEILAPTELRLRATVELDGYADLHLLPAATGEVRVTGVPRSELVGGTMVELNRFWTGAPSLRLIPRGEPPAEPPPLLLAGVAVGLTVDDGLVRGRARVRVEPRRGAAQELRLEHDRGAALVVRDAGGGAVESVAGTLVVRWPDPHREPLTVELEWTERLADTEEASSRLPRFTPLGVARAEHFLQVARVGDRDLFPEVDGRAVPRRSLPDWATGLVDQHPLASYGPARAAGRLLVLRLEPAPGPPALVDVAELRAALSPEGRLLLRARYSVRADRSPALSVQVPAGWTLLAARVDGEAARPLQDGGLRLPIPRSVESVDGPLAFPVELAWLGEQRPWTARELRELQLPTVLAPVAVQRATVHLPPGWRALPHKPGDGRVDAFSRGDDVRFGYGLDEGGERAATEAQALFNEATDAWKSNEFGRAEAYLDELDRRGASNADLSRLRGNLDVVAGRKAARSNAERRVQQQAQARSRGQQVQYEDRKRQAQEAERRGDRAGARSGYQAALELGAGLAALAGDEDFDDDLRQLQAALQEVDGVAEVVGALPSAPPAKTPAPRTVPDTSAPPPWPTVQDPTPPRERLDPTDAATSFASLPKFDYGDPAVDVWGGQRGFGSLGSMGHGGGGGGYGRGSGSAHGAGRTAIDVVAATRFVPLPRVGEAVLFQRLLLRPGEPNTLTPRARRRPGVVP